MNILIIQSRMGIGDMVIFLPYIEAISKKYTTSVTLLVKKSSKSNEILNNNEYIKKLIILDREDSGGKHDGLLGTLKLSAELKKNKFDKAFIFNSSLRFNIICRLSAIKEIYQYPLFKKRNQHLINTAKEFLKKKLNLDVESNPQISIDPKLVEKYKKKFEMNEKKINILLGIGGSGPTKRIPAKTFIKFMRIVSKKYDCRFFLATGKSEDEQSILNEILNTELNSKCVSLDNLTIQKILPIIKNCNISICNDSSFSHLSAALKIKTIVLMADTPLIYGNYSPKMFPVIPDGFINVTHNTNGKEKINPDKIFQKYEEIIN